MVSSSLDPLSIPEGLWRRDDVRAALDRRDIASLFRLVRQHTGASQTRIGIATGLSQGTVCLIMKGSRLVTAIDVLERIADGLAMPDEARVQLGLAPRTSTPCSVRRDSAAAEKGSTGTTTNSSVGAGTLDHERRKLEAALAEAYAAVLAEWAERATATLITPGLGLDLIQRAHANGLIELTAPTGQDALASAVTAAGAELAEGLAGPLVYLALLGGLTPAVSVEWGDTVKRRELFQLLAVTAVSASPVAGGLGLDTDEQERMARAVAAPSRVDAQVINHIDVMFRHCQRQEDALGSRAVLPVALGQRELVHDLLVECPDSLRPRLLSIYSKMSTSIGFYSFDANDFERSWYYFDQARMAAQDAGNAELSIYALCEMSHAAGWQGKTHTAIDAVAAARSLLSKTEDPFMQVCVADKAAQAYAIDGQHTACMVEHERAQVGLASAGRVPAESPAYWYHQGVLASEKSCCLLRLDKPQEAAASASVGLTLFDKSYVTNLAFCTLFLGNARLQAREIDEAARVVGNAAGLIAQTRSARLVTQLHTTRTRMQPWQNMQAVKALDERLGEYGLRVGVGV